MIGAGQALAYTTTQTQTQTTNGQNFTFTFANLPTATTPNINVFIDLYGDYDATSEYADVTIDGNVQAAHTGGSPQCNTTAHTRQYQVPASLISTDNQLVIGVDLSSAVTYSTCANFNPRVVVRVVYTARPDLRVTGSTVPSSGSTAAAGSTFTALYRITNYYQAFTTNFLVRFYYCPTAAATGCVLIGQQVISDNFAANQSRVYTSPTLTMPVTAQYGTRYIRTSVDNPNLVAETNETNNDDYDAISVTTRPDISVTASTVPYTGNTTGPGAQFTGRYTITNAANTSYFSTNFVVRYYYCPTLATATASCTLMTSQTITNNFSSGEAYTYTSVLMTLPGTAAAGLRYVRAIVDATTLLTEGNENNNVDNDAIVVGSSQKPDLTVDSVTAPATGSTANAGATFTVSSQVRNASPTVITQTFQLGYYYCPANNDPTGCTLIAKQQVTANFAANQIRTITSASLTMPDTARVGTGYIRVVADNDDDIDEQVEDNNERYSTITVTVQPDLTVSAATVPASGDTNGPGSTFTASVSLTNAANTSAFDTDFVVEYFYCPGQAATGCVSIGTENITNNFNAGQTVTYASSSLTLPATATPGTRYLRIVVDSTTVVGESDETNNERYEAITVTTGAPDFYVKTFTASVAADVVTYTIEVCNQGSATTSGFDIALYYDLTAAPACAAAADVVRTVAAGLAANACATEVVTRAGTPAGTYNSWAFADQACAVGEADENNNTSSASATVAAQPDISVADGSPDGEVPQDGGVETSVDSTVLNEGGILDGFGVEASTDTAPNADATVDSGPQPDTTSPQPDTTTPPRDSGPGRDSTVPGGDKGGTTDDGGCCAIGGSSASQGISYGLALLVLLLLGRRRRRRRRRRS